MSIEEIINTYGSTGSDYYDMSSGYTLHIASWVRSWKFFKINLPLKVTENGEMIGTITVNASLITI